MKPALKNLIKSAFNSKTTSQPKSSVLSVESLEQRDVPSSVPLHVAGNVLKDDAQHAVALRGVNIISLEWRPDGDNVMTAVDMAIQDWHANLLRLPVNQDFWFGHDQAWTGSESGDGGAAYRSLVDQVIDNAKTNNAYVMLDMHWSDMGVWGSNNGQHFMPDDHTTLFWQDAAKRYANNPAVLFDPYNEPHFENDQPTDAEFALWRNGGTINENGEFFGSYHSPGLQGLINTIRDAGASNVLAPEGLNWGSNLNGVLTGHALSDPAGNLMYQSHLYPNKLADNEVASAVESVSQNYPIYVGEWGSGGVKWQPDNGAAQSNQDMLAYLHNHPKFSWTAWAFSADFEPNDQGQGGEYNLLTAWDPNATTSDYGTYVKAGLAADDPPPGTQKHAGFDTLGSSVIHLARPQLLAAGQFNSKVDSIPDFAVSDSRGTVTIMIGRGDGMFDAGERYSMNYPEGIVAGDFNRDGYEDLAVASNQGSVLVLLGFGDGRLYQTNDHPVLPPGPNAGTVPTYLATADMDGDGILDLVVSDYSHPNVLVYLGNGDGSFRLHDYNFTPNGVLNAEQVVAADLNGDGVLDVAVANKGDGSVSLFKGLGGGYITAAGNIRLPSWGSIGLAAGDLDGDGKADLAIANYGDDRPEGGARRLNVLLNTSENGAISFGEPKSFDFGDHLLNVAIADFDEDGRLDLAATSSGTTVDPNAPKDDSLYVLYNQGDAPGLASFRTPVRYLTYWNPVGLIAADVNGDSHVDLVSADYSSECIDTALNHFVTVSDEQPSASLSVPESIEWGENVSAKFAIKSPAGGANVTGTVTFKVDGVQKKVVALDSPDFSYDLDLGRLAVSATAHTVSIDYSGDANYAPIAITQSMTVTKRDTLTNVSGPDSVAAGKWASFSATVDAAIPGMTGYVTFMDGNKVLATARVVNGQATYRTYSLAIGMHAITATYKGDAHFNASDPSDPRSVKITGNIGSKLRIAKSAISIDRANGLATQTITLQNKSSNALPLPMTLMFQNLRAGSTRIAVVDQTGTSGNNPLLEIPSEADMLMAGESITIQVWFTASTSNVKYTLSVFYI